MCISTGANVSPAPFIEPFAMISGCDKGLGRVCDFEEGRDSF